MNWLSLLFARRYLFSKKSHSVINTISLVSAFAVGIPVAAMVILISIFNGFGAMVEAMYNDFDSDLSIVVVEGKVFDRAAVTEQQLLDIQGVEAVSYILEDNVLLEYRGRQHIGIIRGVDSMYRGVVPIEKMVVEGEYELMLGGEIMQAVVGGGVAYNLGIRPALLERLKVLVPRRGGSYNSLLPTSNYKEAQLFPAGIFTLDAETDGKYVIVPIEFATDLLDYPDRVSAIMVKTSEGVDADRVREQISKALGEKYRVLTRIQKNETIYNMMNYEKWGIFVIGLMVLVLASFSIVGSLVMLIIDKRDDSRSVISVGGDVEFLRSVFIYEGMLISMLGAVGGLLLGLAVCWVQATFGVIGIPAQTFLASSYPVVVKFWDIALIAASFIVVSYIITKFTVVKMIPKSDIYSMIRGVYIVVVTVVMTVVLVGCQKSKVIPDDALRTIFKEIYLSNAYLDSNNKYSVLDRDSMDIYLPILIKHGYTQDDFTTSLSNFSKRKSVRLSDVLNDAIRELDAEHRAYEYQAGLRDSVDVRAARMFKRRVFTDSLIVIKRVADTSKLRVIIPVEVGTYEIKYYYYVDSLDENNSRKNTFTVRDANGKSINTHNNWLVAKSEQTQMIKVEVKEGGETLEMLLASYPTKKMTKPDMRVDSMFVDYYMPRQRALDSLAKIYFDYKLIINGREYFGKPTVADTKDSGTLYIYAPRASEEASDID